MGRRGPAGPRRTVEDMGPAYAPMVREDSIMRLMALM